MAYVDVGAPVIVAGQFVSSVGWRFTVVAYSVVAVLPAITGLVAWMTLRDRGVV
jgi:hypothetical protein